MLGLFRITPRKALIVIHDLLATAAAIVASFYIRFEEAGLTARLDGLLTVIPGFVVYAGIIYSIFHLYEGKWRFASLPDLYNIFRAVTVLAFSLLLLDYILVSPYLFGTFFFGKITIALYWFLQMFFLGGPARHLSLFPLRADAPAGDCERFKSHAGARPRRRRGDAAAGGRERGGQEDPAGRHPVAVPGRPGPIAARHLGPRPVRGHRKVVSDLEERGTKVTRLVLTTSALEPEAGPESILMRARRLGLTASRLPSLDEAGDAQRGLQLAPVAVEDLLLRPSVKIDYRRLESVAQGKSIVVTGGGGSIGAEICDRVVTFGAARLLIIENSEPALHAVLETLADQGNRRQDRGPHRRRPRPRPHLPPDRRLQA